MITFEENINKLPDGQNYQQQMDATLSDARNILDWNDIDPKVFGYKHDTYRCWSKLQSGINPATGDSIIQAKTWFYKLEIKVKNTCSINHALCWDETGGTGYINIDTTYNSGDVITLYMVKILELKANTEDVEITAWYIPPFIEFWNIPGTTKEEQEANKKKYLISNQIAVPNGKSVWFQNGLEKFAVDDCLTDCLLVQHKNSDLFLCNWKDSWGKNEVEFYAFQNPDCKSASILYHPNLFEDDD
jgi:hypothetical protein